ncbi:MAG: hypothetical protein FWD25_13425, partial [Clostridia bacterium]|nr:hypothetical protein [Clostridia bacterium]
MNELYGNCPVFETQHFVLRLVSEADAEDLLVCYSDPKAQEFFNIDNFSHICNFYTVEAMAECIGFWLTAYAQGAFVRFSIVDKSNQKAVGTIEMFGGDVGILRVDLASAYESRVNFQELLDVCLENFYDLFQVRAIATKAIPLAVGRIDVLLEAGFCAGGFKG